MFSLRSRWRSLRFGLSLALQSACTVAVVTWYYAMLGIPLLAVVMVWQASLYCTVARGGGDGLAVGVGLGLGLVAGVFAALCLAVEVMIIRGLKLVLASRRVRDSGPSCAIPGVELSGVLRDINDRLQRLGYPAVEFSRVVVTERPEAHTHDEGRAVVLHLGLPLVLTLSRDELSAIVAHECAHHLERRMKACRAAWRMMELIDDIRALEASVAELTVELTLSRNQHLFVTVAEAMYHYNSKLVGVFTDWIFSGLKGLSGGMLWLIEFECDALAAEIVDRRTFGAALKKCEVLSIMWNIYLLHIRQRGSLCSYIDFLDILASGLPSEASHMISESWAQASPTHPSSAQRLRRLGVCESELGELCWDVTYAHARRDVPLQANFVDQMQTETRAAEMYDLAMRLIDHRIGELSVLPDLSTSEDVVRAVMIMLDFLPEGEVLRVDPDDEYDVVTQSCLACLTAMEHAMLLRSEHVSLRRRQIEKATVETRPKRAMRILIAEWKHSRGEDLRAFYGSFERHRATAGGDERGRHLRVPWEASLAHWQAGKALASRRHRG